MSDGITYCAKCQHHSRPSKSAPPWRWMCVKHPRLEGFGFVTEDTWDDAPPFLYCVSVNGGRCPLYEPADPKQMKMEIGK